MRDTELCKLAFKYGSDKCPQLRKHTYTEYYYDLLRNKKKTFKKVLEIGIGQGSSLFMWRDFFPNAKIYGADNQSDRLIHQTRIKSFLCDQSNKENLLKLIEKTGHDIDLVVEDGSHKPEDQIFTCLTLMPLLKKQVTYIIEDVADPSIVDKLSQYDVEIPIIRQPRKRYDNRLVIVRHKEESKDQPVNISFFAKMPFRVGPDKHLSRVSSIIRGEQIANYSGAKLNPTAGYQDDVCIYVKPPYKPGDNFLFEGRKSYLDIVDTADFYELMRKHPEVGVISLSDWNYKLLKKLLPNEIVNIPQHHCNFERLKRKRKQVKTVGIIGTFRAFEFLPKGLKKSLKERNMKLIEFSKFFTRQDIIDFYMSIDIQIIWRPYYDYRKNILTNPLKIVNSSSFGIPTIAYTEKTFEEMTGCYIPVHTLSEFLIWLDKLRSNPKLYNKYANRCLIKAEDYHIEKIAELYKNLA